jgi:phosphohistidine phosphatase
MEIYFVRHAVAEDRESFLLKNLDDSQRPLTRDGKIKFKKMAKKLRDLIGPVDLIICSPYIRAQETVEILKEHYPKTKQQMSDSLIPSAKPEHFLKWYKSNLLKKVKKIILVGHEPQLSTLASWLVCGSKTSRLNLKKGGALAIEIESNLAPNSAILNWQISPKTMGIK